MEWFRAYNDILDDYKLRKLGAAGAFRFMQLLAYVNRFHRETGAVPLAEWQHFRNLCGAKEEQIRKMVDRCVELNIITVDSAFCHVTNWDKRQYKTDDVAKRVHKYREKQGK